MIPPERITPLPFDYHWRMSISPLPWFAKAEGRMHEIESKEHGRVCLITETSIIDEANAQYIVHACNTIPKLEALNAELVSACQLLLDQCSIGGIEYLEEKTGIDFVELIAKAKGGAIG